MKRLGQDSCFSSICWKRRKKKSKIFSSFVCLCAYGLLIIPRTRINFLEVLKTKQSQYFLMGVKLLWCKTGEKVSVYTWNYFKITYIFEVTLLLQSFICVCSNTKHNNNPFSSAGFRSSRRSLKALKMSASKWSQKINSFDVGFEHWKWDFCDQSSLSHILNA